MIFTSKNEDGEPAWELILKGRKDVTRRFKPEPVGAIRAVCPGRGVKRVGNIVIKSCVLHKDWLKSFHGIEVPLQKEAEREGFKTWSGLMAWFVQKRIPIDETYRIEFDLIPESVIRF